MIYEDFEYMTMSKGVKILKYHGKENVVFVPQYLECRPVTIIGQRAFNAPYIKEVYLPETIEKIESFAFENSNISSIYIPKHVNEIDDTAFTLCPRLSAFAVDENNLYYSSSNGILYNKDISWLINYPNNKKSKKYVVPKTIEILDCLIFKYCSKDLVIYIHNNCIVKNRNKLPLNIKIMK